MFNQELEAAQALPARRTRSNRAFRTTTRPSDPWEALLKLMIPFLVFIGHNAKAFHSNEMHLQAPSLYAEVPHIDIEESIGINPQADPAQLDYLHECDDWIEGKDPRWTPIRVHDHKVDHVGRVDRTKKRVVKERHIRLLTEMADGEKLWIQEEAVRIDAPKAIGQYAISKGLLSHPDFQWVKKHFRMDKRQIRALRVYGAAAKQPTGPRVAKYKFGVRVANSPKHALELDKENGDTGWAESMAIELKQLKDYRTFRILEAHEPMPPGYKRIPYHMVFDVKFDLRKKSRLVAGGNHMDNPKEDIYSGVVSLDSLRLAFTMAAMNNLKVMAADVGNAFLYGKTREKCYIIAGPEFGEDAGKRHDRRKGTLWSQDE